MFDKKQTEGTVLVVASHPDDEMLGCGGTLSRFIHEGKSVHIVLLGEGPLAREKNASIEGDGAVRDLAQSSALNAAHCLGVQGVSFGKFPDNQFDTVPLLAITQYIEDVAQRIQPDIVLTHHAGDMNLDHRITHNAVMTAFRPLPDAKMVTLLGFEVLSSTEYAPAHTLPAFLPNYYINIELFLEDKLKALRCYESEMRPWPHPRSVEAVEYLARLRGCHCGCQAAEAFILYRGGY